MALSPQHLAELKSALAEHGLRATRQRELVYTLLLEHRDHPTAEVLWERGRQHMPGISMATIYNCLESLAACGLIRHVRMQKQAARFCPKDEISPQHAHFYCKKSGKVHDIHLSPEMTQALQAVLPEGFQVEEVELNFRGVNKRSSLPAAAMVS